jgi:hypothetical protein
MIIEKTESLQAPFCYGLFEKSNHFVGDYPAIITFFFVGGMNNACGFFLRANFIRNSLTPPTCKINIMLIKALTFFFHNARFIAAPILLFLGFPFIVHLLTLCQCNFQFGQTSIVKIEP